MGDDKREAKKRDKGDIIVNPFAIPLGTPMGSFSGMPPIIPMGIIDVDVNESEDEDDDKKR